MLLAGFDYGQQGLDEAAALRTLGAEAEFAPDYRRAKSAFAGVVPGFDAFVVEERPEPLAVLQLFLAGARGLGVTTASDRGAAAVRSRRARGPALVSDRCG